MGMVISLIAVAPGGMYSHICSTPVTFDKLVREFHSKSAAFINGQFFG